MDSLMILLLPLAAQYAIPTVSNFYVGAVSRGMPVPGVTTSNLYFGANAEFKNEALSTCVHAEQSATMNAWINGETGLQSLAVNAAPCGYCRQFLYELVTQEHFKVLLPDGQGGDYTSNPLSYYLPDAFGPHDLGKDCGMMDPKYCDHNLSLEGGSEDPLALRALDAAKHSYAQYSKNYSGCAIQMADGAIYTGRYAENAAYDPSLSPLESAITFMNMNAPQPVDYSINRAVLVESPTIISQKNNTLNVLSSFAPGVQLEYHKVIP